jgi:flavin reductase (DIM6/NTAB) family NADH-FMN oxidoreductase RutF
VPDDRTFRDAMGMFASGVTIVTVGLPDGPHGMTANAVMSVSLDPPLIAVAIDNRAFTNRLVGRERHFAINILSDDQIELATRFATRDARGEELFAGLEHTPSEHGDPLLAGAIGQFACEVVGEHVEGDHTVWIGRALSFTHSSANGNPLVFHRGYFSSTSCHLCVVRHDPVVALMAMHDS